MQLAKLGGNPDIAVDRASALPAGQGRRSTRRSASSTTRSVRAPFDGVVTQVDALQPGTYLVSQTAALTNTGAVGLVSTDQIWVDANMKETDLTYVKPGNRVDVSVDTYPGQVWTGTVESISPASGSRVLGPAGAERQRQLGQGRAAHSGAHQHRAASPAIRAARRHERDGRYRHRPPPLAVAICSERVPGAIAMAATYDQRRRQPRHTAAIITACAMARDADAGARHDDRQRRAALYAGQLVGHARTRSPGC